MKEGKNLDAYDPGEPFKELENHPSLVEEAASPSTELWLMQLPVNELGPKDLMEKRWSMHPPDSDSKIGHFYSSRGEMFDVVKENVDRKKMYAILPSAAKYSVRRITSKLCLKRHIELQKAVSKDGHTKSGLTTSEAKSKDSAKSVQKGTLIDEKQASTVTEASVGNEEVEKESKKKKKKKKKKKTSKCEVSS